jgi:hypothetical protein
MVRRALARPAPARPPTPAAGGSVFRSWTPAARPDAYQTFSVRPYWRPASCAEVDCPHWRNGWSTAVDETSDLGRQQAAYIRHRSGRRFTISRDDTGRTVFRFPPEQQCFAAAEHRIAADRPELYVARGGDWRRTIGQPRIYERADQWADDLHSTTDRLFVARSRAGTAGE